MTLPCLVCVWRLPSAPYLRLKVPHRWCTYKSHVDAPDRKVSTITTCFVWSEYRTPGGTHQTLTSRRPTLVVLGALHITHCSVNESNCFKNNNSPYLLLLVVHIGTRTLPYASSTKLTNVHGARGRQLTLSPSALEHGRLLIIYRGINKQPRLYTTKKTQEFFSSWTSIKLSIRFRGPFCWKS
jgi:hypothetical protein